MCGIAGLWLANGPDDGHGRIRTMVAALRHRGPDGNGVWADEKRGVFLGHSRLSIVDLSPAGAQPMLSATGRYCITYNGEIYNHASIRSRLESEGHVVQPWRGHSDTETLLAAIESWGVDAALDSATGMFAFALWDSLKGRLTLSRDRFGEKPLYYASTSRGFAFGSELKALTRSGLIDRRLSPNAAASLLRFNSIPAPRSVYENVSKLMPGHLLEIDSPTASCSLRPYWQVAPVWRAGCAHPFVGDPQAAVDEVEGRLSAAVRDQMVADVPLGAFLSGGIDSSTIVALMQKQSTRPVRTFSIGFRIESYNEAEAARAVAAHLGTQHTELYVEPIDALEVIPRLPEMYCEPFADSSQVPTYLVARMARQHVTVALSGDAGDEVFGGYNRYVFGPMIERRLSAWPHPVRKAAARMIGMLPPQHWDRLADILSLALPAKLHFGHPGEKMMKLGRALSARDSHGLYETFVSQWLHPEQVVLGAKDSFPPPDWDALGLRDLAFAEQMMVQDAVRYLPDDILTKVDRATMAVSLESRVPFLDHRLYEFAASLPLHLKVRDGVTKWALRQVLYRYVPRELVERPKVGFGVPIEHWLRGALREWAEDLLSAASLQKVGMFAVAPVRAAWKEHLSGRRNLHHAIWCVLMYQAWHRRHEQA